MNDDVTYYYGMAIRLINFVGLMTNTELRAFIAKLETVSGLDADEHKLLEAMIAYARSQLDDG